jgi:signal transduction histidine kinase
MRRSAATRESPRRARSRVGSALDSLTARVLMASGALAVLIAAAFVVLAFTVSDLSAAASREAHAKDVVTDTVVLQKLVIDLETRVRGFALTQDERFLAPWRRAQAQLREAIPAFMRDAGDDPARARAARDVSELIRAYITDYSRPLVAIAREHPENATGLDAVREGKRYTDEIRAKLDEFLVVERQRAERTAESAHAEARRALVLGFGGLGASVVMIFLLGFYLTRAIVRPVREVASEANRIARGDLTVHLDERGPGEVGSLKRAFRAMAADLAERQRALEDQNERLRESERLKSELVSIVSHEIRTPLASILGFTSVLLEREVDALDRRRFLEIVAAEARRLTALLDDFLDVQRLEEGPLELSLSVVDVSSLLRTQVALFSAESDKHWLELRLPEEPLLVEGDAGRLAQVFSNLISNAIKYSPEGGAVEVSGEQVGSVVRVSVRDEGFGIPPEMRDRIFTKFFRGSAAAHGIAGSGLGLALSRSVVEAHGGSIDFESTVGGGTTFSLELPMQAPAALAAEAGERREQDA